MRAFVGVPLGLLGSLANRPVPGTTFEIKEDTAFTEITDAIAQGSRTE